MPVTILFTCCTTVRCACTVGHAVLIHSPGSTLVLFWLRGCCCLQARPSLTADAPPPPPREQRPCQNNGRCCFHNFWNCRISQFHFLVGNEDQVFSLIWGWEWYSGDAGFCPATCCPSFAVVLPHSVACFTFRQWSRMACVFSPRLQQNLTETTSTLALFSWGGVWCPNFCGEAPDAAHTAQVFSDVYGKGVVLLFGFVLLRRAPLGMFFYLGSQRPTMGQGPFQKDYEVCANCIVLLILLWFWEGGVFTQFLCQCLLS